MTRYRVPISCELLEHMQSPGSPKVRNWRVVSVDGPWPRDPGMMICTAEDSTAPRILEGKLVEPTVREVAPGDLVVVSLTEIPYPGPLPAPSGEDKSVL